MSIICVCYECKCWHMCTCTHTHTCEEAIGFFPLSLQSYFLIQSSSLNLKLLNSVRLPNQGIPEILLSLLQGTQDTVPYLDIVWLQESWTMVFMLAWWIFHLLSHILRFMNFNITFVSTMIFHFSFSSWCLLYLCVLQHREITDCVLFLYSVLLTSDIVPCKRHRPGWGPEKKILGTALLIQLSYHDFGT